jgi:hypothetical protein
VWLACFTRTRTCCRAANGGICGVVSPAMILNGSSTQASYDPQHRGIYIYIYMSVCVRLNIPHLGQFCSHQLSSCLLGLLDIAPFSLFSSYIIRSIFEPPSVIRYHEVLPSNFGIDCVFRLGSDRGRMALSIYLPSID